MVVRAADLVEDYVNGFALAEASQPPGHPEGRYKLLARLEAEAADKLPITSRVLGGAYGGRGAVRLRLRVRRWARHPHQGLETIAADASDR
jgi:hypothetical protein